MSKLAQDVSVHLDTISTLLSTAAEMKDPAEKAERVLSAHTLVIKANEMVGRMKDGIYRRGITALVAAAEADVRAFVRQAFSKGGE